MRGPDWPYPLRPRPHPKSRAEEDLRDEYTPSAQAQCSVGMPRILASFA